MGDSLSEQEASVGRFESILRNFAYSIQGYRLFLEQLHGPLKDSDSGELPARTQRIVEGLKVQDKKSLVEALRVFAERLSSRATGEATSEAAVEESVTEVTLSGTSARAFVEITELVRRHWWTGPDAQLERLYRSVMIGLVGQFEVLIADLAHQFFRRAPRALSTDEKTLSLSDLREFGSVDAALDYLVDREVDNVLANTAEGWATFFEKRMKIHIRQMAWDWEVFKEIIQRRHIIVHADGRISRRYLQNVSPALVEAYFGDGTIGHPTRLDRDYVERALDHFEIMGTLLCCAVWLKLDRSSLSEYEDTLSTWIYDRLLEGRWEMALAMAQNGADNKELSFSTRTTCRLNAWLCLKRLGRFDHVKTDAEAFDDSALELRFRLVRLAILDREEDFFELLEATDGAGLDSEAWHEWPVFSDIRENPRFLTLAERFAPTTVRDGADGSAGAAEMDSGSSAGALTSPEA